MVKVSIPQEDLNVINTALNGGNRGKVQTISKGPRGELMKAREREPIGTGYAFKDFSGKTVKHQMSVYTGGKHIIVAEAGHKYDDIPQDKRKMVVWHENDFQ